MPKQKTSSGAKKKFKLTGTGKLLRRRAMQSHNLGKKSPKRKRRFGKDFGVDPGDAKKVDQQLGRR